MPHFILLIPLLLGIHFPIASYAEQVRPQRALHLTTPERASVIAATLAKDRIVAVGDHGIILLSDDGKTFRQARSVPSRATLTSVYFIDGKSGWAAGHDDTILMTTDGGESWRLQRQAPGQDKVWLSLLFDSPRHGLAVGQFGLLLETHDGGATWQERQLAQNESNPRHLMHIFPGKDQLFIASEAGALYRSEDGGRNWRQIQTECRGSFWTGLALDDGGIIVAGMRGNIYRSDDRGTSWKKVPSGTQQSITAIAQRSDGLLRLVGTGGTTLFSRDRGRSFSSSVRQDRTDLTTLVSTRHGDVLFDHKGVVKNEH